MTEVTFYPVFPGDAAANAIVVDRIHELLLMPEVRAGLNDGSLRPSFAQQLCNEWLSGARYVGFPTIGENIIGVFWAKPMNNALVEGFQCIRKEYRKGLMAVTCLNAACMSMFQILPELKGIVGIIDEFNKPSQLVARRCGFVKSGKISRYFCHRGEWHDAIIMIKEKSDGTV